MNTPHRHAEVLRAIADGKEVEWQKETCIGCWHEMDSAYNPIDDWELKWRVKPEPKPDYFLYGMYDANSAGYMSKYNQDKNNWKYKMKITIDGETHEPKSVELVK